MLLSSAGSEAGDFASWLNFPPDLPIVQFREEIVTAIATSPVVIIAGEPGSGKTTQIPKFCLLAGRGRQKKIACTQPRRIAAISMAARLEEELGRPGQGLIGYRIRFSDRTSKSTRIKFMTDGILLAEAQRDRELLAYDTIIVDEAHERSLNIDFLLGILKNLLPRRPDLKLIITSATIDTEKFSRHFAKAPVIQVSGRSYPVEIRYWETVKNRDNVALAWPNGPDSLNESSELAELAWSKGPAELTGLEKSEGEESGYIEQAVAAVLEIIRQEAPGDILIFMPTERDIRETGEILEQSFPSLPEPALILPLYGRLSPGEQQRVFQPIKGRKIVIATNVAETSLTVPGIRYVIDTGLARIAAYNPRTRTYKLPVTPIARSSCDQRAGRCGRVGPGICVRLYSEENYLNRALYTSPEIVRSNLAEVILRMTALRLGHPATFPFIDPPSGRAIQDGYQLLLELGALASAQATKSAGTRGQEARDNKLRLSPQGQLMARLPLDPRISRMILAAREHNSLREVCVIAAALSIQDPRQRPIGREKEADKAHRRFAVCQSDFLFYLKLWDCFHAVLAQTGSQGKLRKFCAGHFISYQRLREWQDVHEQILLILAEQRGFIINSVAAENAAIHQALLSGNLRNIGLKKEKNIYQGGAGRELMIFPGSTLYRRNSPNFQPQQASEATGDNHENVKDDHKTVADGSPQWIMAAELVETARLYARTVAAIDPQWLEPLARPAGLMRYTYHDPHWEKRQGQVVAWEKGTLFGLVVVAGRKVAYARIDQDEARRIFLQSALVEGELKGNYPFLEHNRECIAHLRNLEERSRRRDLLVDDQTIFNFYDQALGPEVYDQASLNRLLKTKRDHDFLQMNEEDLSLRQPEADLGEKFPTTLEVGGTSLKLHYCFTPNTEDDGLNVLIPVHLAAQLKPESFEWLVPGMLQEKIFFLLKNLPKNLRRQLVPIPQTAAELTQILQPPGQTSLYQALSRAIYELFGLRIEASAWPIADLPAHLRCRFCLLDEKGKMLAASRDLNALIRREQSAAAGFPAEAVAALRKQWELAEITPADLPQISERLPVLGADGQLLGYLFPGLKENDDRADRVSLRLFTSQMEARAATRGGLSRLYRQALGPKLKMLAKDLVFPRQDWHLAQGLGSLEQLNQEIFTFILREIFAIRAGQLISEAEFAATLKQINWQDFCAEARRLFALALAVLAQRYEVLKALAQLAPSSQAGTLSPISLAPVTPSKTGLRVKLSKAKDLPSNPANFNSVLAVELSAQLKALVYPGFLDRSDAASLARLPCYLKALLIRCQRAQVMPGKDADKAAQLRPYQDRLQKYPNFSALSGTLSDELSEQKKARLAEYRQMLEEYKISLFAQELKTLFPVSPQRLEKKWQEVEELL